MQEIKTGSEIIEKPYGNFKEIKLEPINNLHLRGDIFFIPDYQRGYRWTSQQVKDLLNDIADFSPRPIENSNDKTWYCLQPLVIRECDKKTKTKCCLPDKSFEVIDGQQRLTTIYLIVHYINEMWRGKDQDANIKLIYETREESSEFLEKLKTDSNNEVKINNSNIDYFYISTAYKAINDWVKNCENKNFVKDNFIDKFLNNTKVIWYETKEPDPIAIFTRINIGKIPLTNAELIKALFLNSELIKTLFLNNSKHNNVDPEKIRLKQLEIAKEWDKIEYALQNDEFWFFINEKENFLATRIEFIFDLMASKPDDEDEYFTFRHFNEKFRHNSQEEIANNWREIKEYFQTLDEWFTDRELYHKVGFLISSGETIDELIKIKNNITKKKFVNKLDEKIQNKLKVQIIDLEYNKNNPNITNILLLFNIITMLGIKEETSRFPFARYKIDNWSLEHIHAQNSKELSTKEEFDNWVKGIDEKMLSQELLDKIKNVTNKPERIKELVNEIISYFGEPDIHTIDNLALLTKQDNSSLNNEIFPIKRNRIIELEKNGSFIPTCSRNVFLKYYTPNPIQLFKWSDDDRKYYLENIKNVLKFYLPKQKQGESNER